ncbi:MAG TPA: AmmeMemoRadiSam system protein A [Rhodocyclaceae bacterium]
MSEATLGKALLVLARNAIAAELGANTAPATTHPDISKHGACFVTLTQHGQLRGCIGSLEAHRPLIDDVRANAVAAAFEDPRFPPLGLMELPRTKIEVSLLTAPEPLSFGDEADALARLRPYTDGVILEYGAHRATFLPQVWEQLPEPEVFISHLKQKAGLPAHFWSPEIRLQRYGVQKWSET